MKLSYKALQELVDNVNTKNYVGKVKVVPINGKYTLSIDEKPIFEGTLRENWCFLDGVCHAGENKRSKLDKQSGVEVQGIFDKEKEILKSANKTLNPTAPVISALQILKRAYKTVDPLTLEVHKEAQDTYFSQHYYRYKLKVMGSDESMQVWYLTVTGQKYTEESKILCDEITVGGIQITNVSKNTSMATLATLIVKAIDNRLIANPEFSRFEWVTEVNESVLKKFRVTQKGCITRKYYAYIV